MDEPIGAQDFTQRAWESIYETLEDPYFERRDSELIFRVLRSKLRPVPFGDFLKRYIYRVAELPGAFETIPLEDYVQIVCDSFADNNTPASFQPNGGRMAAQARSWLTRQSVRRETVFLLGFGLRMSLDDVNEFLSKGLRETQLDLQDPFEAICGYCFDRRYGYARFAMLRSRWMQLAAKDPPPEAGTGGVMGEPVSLKELDGDDALMDYLEALTRVGEPLQRRMAKQAYLSLYDSARTLIAGLYNQDKTMNVQRLYTKEDISESDMEHMLCSAIPTDRHGNLKPNKDSLLSEQFSGRRFNRQHMNRALSGEDEIDRFDLITLNFFVFSLEPERYVNAKQRYSEFIRSTNEILTRCRMGRLYTTNPYECFVLMCILSDDPLGTYSDVWELSYSGRE